ncbi:MAG: hypothetical protein H7Z17_03140 [Fuerstia sp.]|nr:hypothetical protein [Fuerstiella sp.]
MRNIIVGLAIVALLAVGLYAQDVRQSASMQDRGDQVQATTVVEDTHRLVWENAERLCQFADTGDDCWVELDKDGEVFLQFTERKRNCDFVELMDHSRGYVLRLYKDALFIKGGNEGFSRFEDFTLYYKGLWVK